MNKALESIHHVKKVLVLGHHTPSFLSVIRSLGRGGVQIHVAWYKVDSIAIYSKYVFKAHNLPPYSMNSNDWKAALINLMKKECFDLVIPCHDEMLFPLQQHKDELCKYGSIYVINDESFDILFDKIKTNMLARALNVNVPEETVVSDIKNVHEPLLRFNFPMVLKPNMSYRDADPSLRNRVEIVSDQEEYYKHMDRMLKYSTVAVQKYFRGRGVGVNLLMKEGVPLMEFQQERLHEPLRGGAGTYRKSAKVSPGLLEASVKILSSLKYTGVAMVEFKVNQDTNEWVLMEVNARFWGSLPLAIASGADFPFALYEMLTQGRTSFKKDYRVGIYSRMLPSDIAWQIRNIKADRSDPTLLTVSPFKVISEWVVNTITLKERIDTLAFDDMLPFYKELAQSVHRVTGGLGSKIGKRVINNNITRRIHMSHMRGKAANSKNVLFVCYGNVCRSPFAEYLLRKYIPSLNKIESAGFFKESGRKPPDEAMSAALKLGIDLSSHRSKEITEDMVNAADIIFVFDYNNYKELTSKYRFAKGRTFFIGSLLKVEQFFLDDPWGKPDSFFDTVYGNINQALLTLKGWIENG